MKELLNTIAEELYVLANQTKDYTTAQSLFNIADAISEYLKQ